MKPKIAISGSDIIFNAATGTKTVRLVIENLDDQAVLFDGIIPVQPDINFNAKIRLDKNWEPAVGEKIKILVTCLNGGNLPCSDSGEVVYIKTPIGFELDDEQAATEETDASRGTPPQASQQKKFRWGKLFTTIAGIFGIIALILIFLIGITKAIDHFKNKAPKPDTAQAGAVAFIGSTTNIVPTIVSSVATNWTTNIVNTFGQTNVVNVSNVVETVNQRKVINELAKLTNGMTFNVGNVSENSLVFNGINIIGDGTLGHLAKSRQDQNNSGSSTSLAGSRSRVTNNSKCLIYNIPSMLGSNVCESVTINPDCSAVFYFESNWTAEIRPVTAGGEHLYVRGVGLDDKEKAILAGGSLKDLKRVSFYSNASNPVTLEVRPYKY